MHDGRQEPSGFDFHGFESQNEKRKLRALDGVGVAGVMEKLAQEWEVVSEAQGSGAP